MKKANKILMATVAVLLSLVLITTSVVSGIFAKFVLAKETKIDQITLKQFGVALKLSGQGSYKNLSTYNTVYEGYDISCIGVATDFAIGSGDEYKNSVNIYIDTNNKTPTVPAALKITIDLNYTLNNFRIVDTTNTNFEGIDDGQTKYFMPLGFSFGGTASSCGYVAGPWITGDDASTIAKVENYIATKIAEKISAGDTYTGSPVVDKNTISIQLTKDKPINIVVDGETNNFYMGFGWPDNNKDANGTDYTNIATYLAQNIPDNSTMQIKYTISIEQTGK